MPFFKSDTQTIEMYKYLHDQDARTVFRVPMEPQVNQQMRRGKPVGWHVSMEFSITRGDNFMEGSQWKYPTSAYPVQHLDAHYTREQAVSYFRMHHEPRGSEISEGEYKLLHEKYENEAKSRR